MAQLAKTMDRTDWFLLLLLSILWGGAYFFSGYAVKFLPPMTVVLVRVGLAALTLLPIMWWYGYSLPKSFAQWIPFIGMGLLNNVLPFGFIFSGQTQITVGLASIINALTPLFTILVLASFGAERLTLNRIIGVLFGVLGVAILSSFDGAISSSYLLGIVLCMAGALSYGFAALWGQKYLAEVPPIMSATCQLICSSIIMAIIVAFVDKPWTLPAPSSQLVLYLILLAVFATAFAYLLFFKIMVRAGAGNVMLVTLLIPVSALFLGNFFLNETIHVREVSGAAIIAVGLLFIDGRLVPKFGRPQI